MWSYTFPVPFWNRMKPVMIHVFLQWSEQTRLALIWANTNVSNHCTENDTLPHIFRLQYSRFICMPSLACNSQISLKLKHLKVAKTGCTLNTYTQCLGKGIIHPKIKSRSSFTHPSYHFLTNKIFVHLWNTNENIFANPFRQPKCSCFKKYQKML